MGRTACTEPQCLYSTAIALLPLWAVRPIHSLSACTVELYLFSPYWPYGLYRASVPVQGVLCLLFTKLTKAKKFVRRMNVCRLGRKRKRNSVIIYTIMVTLESSCGNKVTTFIRSILYNSAAVSISAYHLFYQTKAVCLMSSRCICCFNMILRINSDYSIQGH